ncbi:ribonuclease Th1 [Trichophyton tonsurans CBS 112818]|uniref:ribonuclease T1 n=1 Tax=Trichophyton tonsurans (strain CBS 112818) TaxID=647933 RepID=F2S6H2_TRIT1|nr:ribonuclease Th1 [Trichophyton tonsurans CBS 112818]
MKLLSILTFAAAVSAIKCGRNVYSEKQVKDADAAACNHVQGHTRAGKYPHVYKNHERFTFKGLKGPFFEFPLLNSGIYKRGSPGPDPLLSLRNVRGLVRLLILVLREAASLPAPALPDCSDARFQTTTRLNVTVSTW